LARSARALEGGLRFAQRGFGLHDLGARLRNRGRRALQLGRVLGQLRVEQIARQAREHLALHDHAAFVGEHVDDANPVVLGEDEHVFAGYERAGHAQPVHEFAVGGRDDRDGRGRDRRRIGGADAERQGRSKGDDEKGGTVHLRETPTRGGGFRARRRLGSGRLAAACSRSARSRRMVLAMSGRGS
jgi:hypothetical protein